MSGSVDDIDAVVTPADGGIFLQNRNAAFLFQFIGIHDPFRGRGAIAKGAGLAQELVYQGCLAMVDVRDDGDISEFADHDGFYGRAGDIPVKGQRLYRSMAPRVALTPAGIGHGRQP